jgi:DNA polymerase III subunit alpha
MTLKTPDFVHLHVHTQYSLLDGAIRLDRLLQRCKDFEMDSVAITDHGTMFGAVEFYEKATAAQIKPVIGCECYVAPRSFRDKTPLDKEGVSHLVLLAQNQEGYQNLCKMASIAQLEGFYYKPRIDKEILKAHSHGLIALSACLHGEVASHLVNDRLEKAEETALFYQNLFGENNFFLEVQNNGIDIQEKVNKGLLDISRRLSIPLVASNDCHYLDKDDVRAHDVLLCIQTGKVVHDDKRLKFRTDQLYFKSREEMCEYFKDYPGAIENTVEIAGRCHVEFDFKTYHFPLFETPPEETPDSLFEKEAYEGFGRVMAKIRKKKPDVDESIYKKRLDYEISVIKSMGFPGYFLIVADFIRYAKQNRIPVGPGRGSAAGSLVAYCLGITDLDPLEYDLIFERFLNPSRISMPDIDVDFCINGREEVFKYVVNKYGGGDYVAQIITFGKLKTRAVIRDVGRALGIALKEVDAIAKMVPDVLGIKLKDALEQEPKLKQMADERADIGELIQICLVLEGLPRHASTHAAGVVIGDKPLVNYMPLFKGKKGEVVTQFDMKYVEKIGLVKFDFLGLRNLTVIENTLKLIEKQGKTPPDLTEIDMEDAATYELLSNGDTTGVFQLESSGMKDLLVRLKPACFADIIALVALYRPGPLDSGMVDEFVERKHGRKAVKYLVPQLEPILKETYGVIAYQEQVMKIAGDLANYSMADADGLRKAMGKKIQAAMVQHRDLFMKGAKENQISEEKSKQIYDLMETFGRYGFNKSHSAAYALIAYQTAYLKAHYPVESMASLLTSEMHSIDGVVKFIAECRNHGIVILPPDVNESEKEFTVVDQKIRFGLVAVKNVGEGAIETIIKARNDGKFISLFDFCGRVDLRKVNKRVVEALIRCGAFDSMGIYRSRMMAVLEEAIDFGQRVQRERTDPQLGLFDLNAKEPSLINTPSFPNITEWDQKQLLANEKDSLGFYISGHPLGEYEDILDKFTSVDTLTIQESTDKAVIRIGGLVKDVKVIRTKKGDPMAFVTLEDMHGTLEITVFTSIYKDTSSLLIEDSAILVEGQVQKDEKSIKVLADSIITVDKAEETWTANVHLNLDISTIEKHHLLQLQETLKKYPGSSDVYLHLRDPDKSDTIIALPKDMRLKAGVNLTREVKAIFGYDAIETVCSEITCNNMRSDSKNYQKKGKNGYAR